MSKITSIEYNKQELGDILTTAVEGGINYWCSVVTIERADDLTVTMIRIKPNGETEGDFPTKVLQPNQLQIAVNSVLSGTVKLRSDLVEAIASGDIGNIDATAADCLVQIAAFKEVVYG